MTPASASAQNSYVVNTFTDTAAGTLETGGGFGPGVNSGGNYDLRGALFAAMAAGGTNTITFSCPNTSCTITLAAPLPPIFEATTNTGTTAPSAFSLTIDGGTQGKIVLDGNSGAGRANRVFWVDNVAVTLKNLVIQNALALGGNGGTGNQNAGGGGAGFGAGLFVNQSGAHVAVQNTSFLNCNVQGGSGALVGSYAGGGGGGGMGFAGGNGAPGLGGGGGGVAGPGATGANGGSGGAGGGGGGATYSSASSTTGGAAFAANQAGGGGSNFLSGSAGFGGGGGGSPSQYPASGGFGGGGAGDPAGVGGGNGGFGGGGGGVNSGHGGGTAAAVGNISGGAANPSNPNGNGGGGGGAAAGPAIFVVNGAVTLTNVTGANFTAIAGLAGTGASNGTASSLPVFNYAGTVNGSSTVGSLGLPLITQAVGQKSSTLTATLIFTTAVTTSNTFTTNVLTQGAPNLDFNFVSGGTCASGTTYAVGATCTVEYTFTPTHPGLRLGGITLVSSGATVASAVISGTGTGPMVSFSQSGATKASATSVVGGFYEPHNIAVDALGNVYVAGDLGGQISEIMAVNGQITSSSTVNALTTGGYLPTGVAVDGVGDVFFTEVYCECLYEIVAVNGQISGTPTPVQIASGFAVPFGVALDASGDIFIADKNNEQVKELVASNGQVTPGSTPIVLFSGLDEPTSVVVDASGDLIFANSFSNLIYKAAAVNGQVTSASTLVSLGGGFSQPFAATVDAAGDVFVADQGHNSIKEILAVNGQVNSSSTVVTLATGFFEPFGIATDASGNIYLGDTGNNQVEMFAYATPAVVNFPTATASGSTDSTDGTKTVTLQNVGNAPLYLAVPTASGITNPTTTADFTFATTGSTACPSLTSTASTEGILAAGASCTLPLTFTPLSTTSGSKSESLIFTDNNLNNNNAGTGTSGSPATATQTITLTGTAVLPPTVTGVSPNKETASIYMGGTVIVQGTGFVVGNTSITIGTTTIPAASVTVLSSTSLDFIMPSSSTTSVVDIVVNVGGASSAISSADQFSYMGPPSGAVAFSPSTITVGGTSTFTVTITNPNAAQGLDLVAFGPDSPPSGTSFVPNTVSNTCGIQSSASAAANFLLDSGSVNAGGTCTVSVSMTSSTPGNHTFNLGLIGSDTSAGGNGNSPSATLIVLGNTATSLSLPPAPISYGSQITATVAPVSPATGTPTGNVTFYLDGSTTGTTVALSNGQAALTLPGLTPGSHTVTATYAPDTNSPLLASSSTTSSTSFIYVTPSFVVTTSTDDTTATIGHCPVANSPASTNCSLRDAIAAANTDGGGNITFASSTYSGATSAVPQTFSVTTGGTLNTTGNLTITGPTDSNGNNLVALDGGGSVEILNNSGTVMLTHLIFRNGRFSNGGAIASSGSLVLSYTTLSNNQNSGGLAGALYVLSGTATLTNSTFIDNTANGGGGGVGVFGGTVSITNTTFYGNLGRGSGGGLEIDGGTTTLTNTTFSGNSGGGTNNGIAVYSGTLTLYNSIVSDGISGNYTDGGGNVTGATLSALGNYGGPTQTMLPLPGSAAICAGKAMISGVTIPTTDQRGATHSSAYCPAGQIDAGAVQTSYALNFTTSPTDTPTGSSLAPTPVVTLSENSIAFTAASESITVKANAGTLSGTLSESTSITAGTTAGQAKFTALSISPAESADYLIASLTLNGSIATTANSLAFNVISVTPPVIAASFSSTAIAPGGSSTLTVTITNPNATASLDHLAFSLTLPSGLSFAGGTSVNQSGCGSSTESSTSTALSISGGSLSAGGTCTASALVYAPSLQGTYFVSSGQVTSAEGNGNTATATLYIQGGTSTTLALSAVPITYGSTVTATVAPVSPATGTPTGNVTFYLDGSTTGTAVALSNGQAALTLPGLTPGSHTVTATYTPDINSPTLTGSTTSSFTSFTYVTPSFVVTTLLDDATGVPGYCPIANAPASTNCSLRDAIAAANSALSGNITFASSTYTSATATNPAIYSVVTGGTLNISGTLVITGPTDANGNDLIAIDGGNGGNPSLNNPVGVEVMSNSGTSTLTNLIVRNGYTGGQGGGIYNTGNLTLNNAAIANNFATTGGGGVLSLGGAMVVNNSTFSGNVTYPGGGGIYLFRSGTLTVTNSTFVGNSCLNNGGGAIAASGASASSNMLNVYGSTFTGNTAQTGSGLSTGLGVANIVNSTVTGNVILSGGGGGAGLYVNYNGTMNVINSTIAGNTATTGSALILQQAAFNIYNSIFLGSIVNNGGTYTDGGGNVTSGTTVGALGSYGGSTQTLIPAPGSSAICAGKATISGLSIPTIDQRGAIHSSAYCSAGQIDAGAVQTSYAAGFTAQPPASGTTVGTAMSPAPVVQVQENSLPYAASGVAVTLTDSKSAISSGNTGTSTGASGADSFGNLVFGSPQTNDTLIASVPLVIAGITPTTLTATSNSFSVGTGSASIQLSNTTQTYTGSPLSATATTTPANLTGVSVTYIGTGGTTYASSTTAPTNVGTYSVSASLSNANYTATPVTGTFTINQASASIQLSNTTQTYTGSPLAVTATTTPSNLTGLSVTYIGTGSTTYASSTTAPTNVGTYSVSASLSNANYNATPVTGTFTIGQASASIQLSNTTQTYTGSPLAVTATTTPVGLASVSVTYTGTGSTTYSTSTTAPTNAGTYSISASLNNANYTATPATGTFTISQASASIQLSNTSQTYTGSPLPVTATTTPTSLSTVNVTYTGTGSTTYGTSTTAPTNAGTYSVTASLTNSNYSAQNLTGTLTISKASASVQFSNTAQTYTGSPLAVTTTTTPVGLASVSVTYAGAGSTTYASSTTAPTNVGTYSVSASLNNSNYAATPATGTFTISQASASIQLSNTSQTYTGSPLAVTATTTPVGLASVSVTYAGTGSTTYTSSTTAPTNVGTYSVTASLTNNNYSAQNATGTFTISPATATVLLSNTAQTYTGSPLAVTAVTSPVGLSLSYVYVGIGSTTYASSATPPTRAGTYTVAATLSNSNYSGSAGPTAFTIAKATPSIVTAPTASAINYGAALSSSTLNGGAASYLSATVSGSFAWTTPTTVPIAGTTSYSVTLTPSDATDYNSVTTTVSITVSKVTPTINTVPTASVITYGATLSTSTLTNGAASVAGTFAWTSPTTIPTAGTANYSVTFTPTDTTDYNPVLLNVSLSVNKATTTISTPPTAAAITYGSALSASSLSGGVASVAGTFAWTNGSTLPTAGTTSYSVTFTPTDATDYSAATVNVSVVVNKAIPTITTNPTASAVTYGAALSTVTLTGGTASTPGTFAWTTGATIPTAGTASYSVTFTPTDTNDYSSVALNISVTVSKVTPTVTTTPTSSPITYGAALSTSTLTGGTASVAGSFAWTNPTTIPPGGTASYSVTFTPTSTTNYNTTTTNVSLIVNKAAPAVTVSPVTILYATTPTLLTASISYSGPSAPTGGVTFQVDNGAAVSASCSGTSSPLQCTASYTTGTLSPTTHTITASLGTDGNYLAESGIGTLTVNPPPDFTFNFSGNTYATVIPGQTATYSFSISPQDGIYPAAVNFGVTGLPPGATYAFTPSSVAQNGGAQLVTLTIHIPSPAIAKNQKPSLLWKDTGAIMFGLLLPFFVVSKRRKQLKARMLLLLVLVAGSSMIVGMTGCGTGNGFLEQSPQNYSLSITASSGSAQHSETVVLNVQ